jgi:hypothetical protein
VNREDAQEEVRNKIKEKYKFSVPDVPWFVDEPPLILNRYSDLIDLLPDSLTKEELKQIMEKLHRYSQKISDRTPEEKRGRLSDLNEKMRELDEKNANKLEIINEIVNYTNQITNYKTRSIPEEESYEKNRKYLESLLNRKIKRVDKKKAVYAELDSLPFENQEKLLKKIRIFMDKNASKLSETGLLNIINGAIRAVETGLKWIPKSPNECLSAYFEIRDEEMKRADLFQKNYSLQKVN